MSTLMPTDTDAARDLALATATELYQGTAAAMNTAAMLTAATAIYDWLVGPTVLVVIINPIREQGSGRLADTPWKGTAMQLTDTQQVTLTVQAQDAKGAPVPTDASNPITWTIDNQSVATLNVSSDTQSCTVIAGTVGSGVIAVTAGSLSATVAVDVIPGSATKFVVNEGTPEDQPTTPAR